MSDASELDSLISLHADLIAFSHSHLLNVERLWRQLESRLEDFRRLLDKHSRNSQSRQQLDAGRVIIHDVEYTINSEFTQSALQLADILDLDELESASLVLENSENVRTDGRSCLEVCVVRFHQQRKFVLDCFRLLLQHASPSPFQEEKDATFLQTFRAIVTAITNVPEVPGDGSVMMQTCLRNMADIRHWLQRLTEKMQTAAVLGQPAVDEVVDLADFQRDSLIVQHELLGLILQLLVKTGHAGITDVDEILSVLSKAEKYDHLLLHYIPAVGAFMSCFGAPGPNSLEEARQLNQKIIGDKEQASWSLPYVRAAVTSWWVSEYSGRSIDNPSGSPKSNTEHMEEQRGRSKLFGLALKDGAFDFTLSIVADVTSSEWPDPARQALRQWLQRQAPLIAPDMAAVSDIFRLALMEQLESFVDAFITNMPDVLRRLRVDEDEQRQLNQAHEHDLDLERFLVIISYIFENRADAAMNFWSDPESNLAGFLQWASRRASTPLVSAFCEMVRSLSVDEDCAACAHEFLLDDGSWSGSKTRKTHSLNWNQIFSELKYFVDRVREQPVSLPHMIVTRNGKTNSHDVETEPESAMLLESYLRLVARLCGQSAVARQYVLNHSAINLPEVLFQYATSPIPSRLRACVFETLESLATNKTPEIGGFLWTSLDLYLSGGYSLKSAIRNSSSTGVAVKSMETVFLEIGSGFEEANAFVQLLNSLVAPLNDSRRISSNECLSFPEQLGSGNRVPGINPYVDFVMDIVLPAETMEIADANQLNIMHLSCLDFMRTCISSFNENLVVLANTSSVSIDHAVRATDLLSYITLHPFSRTLQWLYSDRVMDVLFRIIHYDPAGLAKRSPNSPLVLCVVRAIEVVLLGLQVESTYLNLIRPAVKNRVARNGNTGTNAMFATFQDGILKNLSIFADLGLLVGVGHSALSIAALELLEKLCTSLQLVSGTNSGIIRRNKAVAALEMADEGVRISQIMLTELTSYVPVESGSSSDAYQVKLHIVDLILSCLQAAPGTPNIAHVLLGFECSLGEVVVSSDGAFARRESIFHTILEFLIGDLAEHNVFGLQSWLITLKKRGFQILKTLWTSPLTSVIVLSELEREDFSTSLIAGTMRIDHATLWDGIQISSPVFASTSSAQCLADFLHLRAMTCEYVMRDLYRACQEHSPSRLQRLLRILLGTSITADNETIQTITIYDLADFLQLDLVGDSMELREAVSPDIDLHACLKIDTSGVPEYDLEWAKELLMLRQKDPLRTSQQHDSYENNPENPELTDALCTLLIANNTAKMRHARIVALKLWTQVLIVMTAADGAQYAEFKSLPLRSLRFLTPIFDKFTREISEESLDLANLVQILIFSTDFSSYSTTDHDSDTSMIADGLSDLFQICLRAISSPSMTLQMKDILYSICYRYLTYCSSGLWNVNVMRTRAALVIKTGGVRLFDIIGDDVCAGDAESRSSATLLLNALITGAHAGNVKQIVELLSNLNLIGLLIESITQICHDLSGNIQDGPRSSLSNCFTQLMLLLGLSQTRIGAAAVCHAGLFGAIRQSELFSTDPELSPYASSTTAVFLHYQALLLLVQIINSIVLSRGTQNQQVLTQARTFLSDSRHTIMTVFKKSATKRPADTRTAEQCIDELADSFLLLLNLSGFTDLSQDSILPKPSSITFT